MNTVLNKLVVSASFALSLGLMSCQENSLVTPDKPATTPSESVNDIISPNRPKVYKLTKYGNANLTYDGDGRLTRVMLGADVRGNKNVHTEYTYSAGSIHAISYVGTSLFYDQTFLLNANGRCYEYKELRYLYSNSSQTEKKEVVYTYNAKGQLQKAADKSNAAVRTEYTYNADGDLNRAIQYGLDYTHSTIKVQSDYTFSYDQPTGDPILTDRYVINSELAGFPDLFLNIFGTPSKHLVKLITEKSSLGGQYYTYTLNADGYATKRDEYSLSSGALVESRSYNYLVTNMTVQL
ncbi:MAG: hypothetical protein EOO39_26445 [Cytophagaceae bacterium]|nr:MAG: hypothetical protein EOO39_26445 [Cytophagaceae bacterium]